MAKDFDQWDESHPANQSESKQQRTIGDSIKEHGWGGNPDAFRSALRQHLADPLVRLADDHDWTMKSHKECVDEIARLQRCYDGVKARAEKAEARFTEEDSVAQKAIAAMARIELKLNDRSQVLFAKMTNVSAKVNQLIGHDESAAQVMLAEIAQLVDVAPDEIHEALVNVVSGVKISRDHYERQLGQIREILNGDVQWLEVECNGDVVQGVRTVVTQLDHMHKQISDAKRMLGE